MSQQPSSFKQHDQSLVLVSHTHACRRYKTPEHHFTNACCGDTNTVACALCTDIGDDFSHAVHAHCTSNGNLLKSLPVLRAGSQFD